jgi:hypothetical protein
VLSIALARQGTILAVVRETTRIKKGLKQKWTKRLFLMASPSYKLC